MGPDNAQEQIEQALALLDLTIGEMVESAREELDGADPLAGQCWASALLGLLRTGPDVPFDAAELVIGALGRFLEETPQDDVALGLLHVLAGLAPTAHATRSAAEILERNQPNGLSELPGWAMMPPVQPSLSLITTDVFGDQTGIYVSFEGASPADRHVLIVLVDHNLRGVLKELFVTDEVDELLEAVQSDLDGDVVHEVEPAEALRLVAQAIAVTNAQPDHKELCGEEVAAHLPLVAARVRAAGLGDYLIDVETPDPTAINAAAAEVVHACGFDGAVAVAATRFVKALGADSGLPLRASPLAVLMALFDGLGDQAWTTGELDGLQQALPTVTAYINADSPLSEEIQGDLAEAWTDLWPEARRLLVARERLAPGRRAVMEALVGEDEEDDEG